MSTENMTIADAIDRMGITIDHDNEDLVIARFGPAMSGMEWQKPLSDVADEQVGTNLFFSTGTFFKGSVSRSVGRTGENVRRVLEIPLDFDLKDYLPLPSDTIYEMDAENVRSLAAALWINTESLLTELGLIPHRVHYTGNGIGAFLRFSDDNADIDDIRRGVKELVATLNEYAVSHAGKRVSGGELENVPKADTAATDAGTRLMRIPFGISEKASSNGVLAVRYPEITRMNTDAPSYTLADLQKITGGPAPDRSVPHQSRTATVAVGDEAFRNTVAVMSKNWKQGDRHQLALAISAWFARSGVPRDQAERLVRSMAGDDEELESDRMVCVATTYDRWNAGDSVEGYYGLRSMLTDEDTATIDKEMVAVWKMHHATPESGPSTDFTRSETHADIDTDDREALRREVARAQREYPEPPIDAEYGWYGRFVDHAVKTHDAGRSFLLMTALAYTGAYVGRRIGVPIPVSSVAYPNMYLFLVGPSGSSRKSTVMNYVSKTMPNAKPVPFQDQASIRRPIIARDMGSGQAVVKTMSDAKGSPVLLINDEATRLFKAMDSEGSQLIPTLTSTWDSPPRIENNVKNDPSAADNPFLSFVAGIPTDLFSKRVTEEHIRSGLMNRSFMVFSDRMRIHDHVGAVDMDELGGLWHEFVDAVHSYADGAILSPSDDAEEVIAGYRLHVAANVARMRERGDPYAETEADLVARYPTHVSKLALMFAITDRADRIERRHADAAISLMTWSGEQVRRRYRDWGNDAFDKATASIERCLKRQPVWKNRKLKDATKSPDYKTSIVSSALKDLETHGVIIRSPDAYTCLRDEYDAIISAYGTLQNAAESNPKDVIRKIRKGASS